MNQIILASHGGLAEGALDTVRMVVGEVSNAHAVTLERDDREPITAKVKRLIATFDQGDTVYVLTDMLGSSVNNAMVEYAATRSGLTVIAGMNMPLVLALVLSSKPLSAGELRATLADARSAIVDCTSPGDACEPVPTTTPAAPVPTTGKRSQIALVRLDYRLLHGQVVFSWVGKTGANRIIVVDGASAHDEVKKRALKLAKPANVRLNVFDVECALSKMKKLEMLGEKVMFIFGNTHELLEFSERHAFPEVNYGATANKDGAVQYGGKDGSVFLDASEQADTKELLGLGTKIFVQQTPTYKRVELASL